MEQLPVKQEDKIAKFRQECLVFQEWWLNPNKSPYDLPKFTLFDMPLLQHATQEVPLFPHFSMESKDMTEEEPPMDYTLVTLKSDVRLQNSDSGLWYFTECQFQYRYDKVQTKTRTGYEKVLSTIFKVHMQNCYEALLLYKLQDHQIRLLKGQMMVDPLQITETERLRAIAKLSENPQLVVVTYDEIKDEKK